MGRQRDRQTTVPFQSYCVQYDCLKILLRLRFNVAKAEKGIKNKKEYYVFNVSVVSYMFD